MAPAAALLRHHVPHVLFPHPRCKVKEIIAAGPSGVLDWKWRGSDVITKRNDAKESTMKARKALLPDIAKKAGIQKKESNANEEDDRRLSKI